jgi:hypothetical protein
MLTKSKNPSKSALTAFFAVLLVLFLAPSCFAELAGMGDASASEQKSESGLKALIGLGGGNTMIADDGALFMSLRIGLDLKPLVAVGAWASTSIDDVRNYSAPIKQMINYKSFGAFVELFPLRFNEMSISVPIQVGGGVVNIMEADDEAFAPEDYFFTADMAAHFNYRLTKMLEISIGGGYRMFAGIEENYLDNMDFCTPFGELRFTVRE